MTLEQTLIATVVAVAITLIMYWHCDFREIQRVYRMWFSRDYWTNYNTVEAVSWLAKALVIVPGLVFGHNIWQLYWITLITSAALIWASNRKLLPTLVGFNTLWIWLSMMVIAQNLV